MRVGIIALQHESNTFSPRRTSLADFETDGILRGDAIRAKYAATHHEVGGFFAALDEAAAQAVPVFAARATPGGRVTAQAYATLRQRLLDALTDAGRLDGLLVAPHGAAVAEDESDMDGHWLALLRRTVGATVPIVCTLDLHANLSPRMIESCDATIVYRTNPHLDQRDRGIEAGRLLMRTLRGEIRPTQAAAFPSIAINIERQLTAQPPVRDLLDLADGQLRRPGVLSNSVLLGFPYADVPEMGSSFIAVTDGNTALAQELADELAVHVLARHNQYVPELIEVSQAVDDALHAQPPVCLLDLGDNVGGGSPGDGTFILHELHRRHVGPAVACICDPAAAQAARAAGASARRVFDVGGKSDDLHGPPLRAEFTVRGLFDGRFSESQPRHGGRTSYDMGPSAVLDTASGLTLIVHTRRTPPFSLGQLTSCGLDPSAFRILVAKGVHAPVAAYREVCRTFIRVNTPGVTTADMIRLPYHHRRRPMLPFEPLD